MSAHNVQSSLSPQTVDEYLEGLPDMVAVRLGEVREAIRAAVPGGEERIRYGMPAMMLGGRYALHFAAWTKHIGLYPVPVLPDPLEAAVAPLRSGKDSVVLPHRDPLPVELVGRIARAVVELRAGADS